MSGLFVSAEITIRGETEGMAITVVEPDTGVQVEVFIPSTGGVEQAQLIGENLGEIIAQTIAQYNEMTDEPQEE